MFAGVRIWWLRALLLATAIAGCGVQPRATSADLRTLGLRVRDLPAGAAFGTGRFWSDSRAAARDRVPASLYLRHHRVNAYQATFFRSQLDSQSLSWMERADSEITAFQEAPGAVWYLRRLAAELRRSGVQSAPASGTLSPNSGVYEFPYRPVSVPAIGQGTSSVAADWASDEFAYTTRVVVFREGRYVAFVRLVGFEGRLPLNIAIAIARSVDRRIKRADSQNADLR